MLVLCYIMNTKINKKVAIIGVPQDLGQTRRGVDMGPSAIRVAGLHNILSNKLKYEVFDYGNIKCHDIAEHYDSVNIDPKLRHLDQIIESSLRLKGTIEQALSNNYFPVVLGGDHSLSIGMLAGLKSKQQGKTGILWIDAHGDFNTSTTTPSGNIHGMPFAIATGRGDSRLTSLGPSPTISEEHAVLIGARDIDSLEAKLLQESKVTVFTMQDIDEQGFANIARKALKIATSGIDNLHISLDIDVLDPSEAPGTGTSVPGGLTYREGHLLMEMVHNSKKLSSMDVVEVNPALDNRNKTAALAVELISSALGKTIL